MARTGSHALLAGGALVGAAALVVVGMTRERAEPSSAPATCTDGGPSIDEIWNADAARRVTQVAQRASPAFGAEVAAVVRHDLDAYAQTWTAAQTQTCERDADPTEPGRREAIFGCLQARRAHVQALVAALEAADTTAVQRSWRAARSLPLVEDCGRSDTESLTDPTQAEQLDSAAVMIDLGQFDAAATVLDAVQPAEDEPERGRTLLLRGLLLAERGLAPEAVVELEAAAWRSVALDRPALTFTAALALARIVSLDPARAAEARRWWHLASATAQRMIDAPQRQHELLTVRAILLHREGNQGAALALYEPALSAAEQQWGEQHPLLLEGLIAAAIAAAELRQVAAGEGLATRAVAVAKRALGRAHPQTAEAARAFGAALVGAGEARHGAPWLDKAVTLRGEHADATEGVRLRLAAGKAWAAAGESEAAQTIFADARRFVDAHGADAALRVDIELGLAAALRDAGKAAASIEHLRSAVAALDEASGRPPAEAFAVRIQLARALRDQLRLDEARAELSAVLAAAEPVLGATAPLVGDAHLALADVELAAGASDEALRRSRVAVKLLVDGRGADHPSVHLALTQLGAACLAAGRDAEAVAAFERAVAVAKAANAPADRVAASQLSLASALWRVGEEDRAQQVARAARIAVADATSTDGLTVATVDAWFSRRSLDPPV